MAPAHFVVAVAAIAALACVASAQPAADLYGTAGGAPLFASSASADYANDTALVGFRFTYYNATGADVTDAARDDIVMDAQGMINAQFISPSGPCFSENIQITLKDDAVFEWHEEDDVRSYSLSYVPAAAAALFK